MLQASTSPSSDDRIPLPAHIWLVVIEPSKELLPEGWHLQIPIAMIQNFAVRRSKFLRYVGYCVVGVRGDLKRESKDSDHPGTIDLVEVNEADELVDQGIYHFCTPPGEGHIAASFVDLHVAKKHTVSYTTTTTRDSQFVTEAQERDGGSIFDDLPLDYSVAQHIIPLARGDDCIQHIVANRPFDHGSLDIRSVDDVRNGFMGGDLLNRAFNNKQAIVIIKTPNPILDMDDIPRRIERSRVRDGTAYPAQCRYTFKHMEKDMWLGSYFIDNIDATFVQHDEAKLPSGLLLDYVFGAAAVKHWGAGLEDAFDKLGHKPFRPVHVLPPSSGRRRTVHEEDKLDAFDLVMIFWANTAAARQRREEEDAAFRSSISTWASDVDQTFIDPEIS